MQYCTLRVPGVCVMYVPCRLSQRFALRVASSRAGWARGARPETKGRGMTYYAWLENAVQMAAVGGQRSGG